MHDAPETMYRNLKINFGTLSSIWNIKIPTEKLGSQERPKNFDIQDKTKIPCRFPSRTAVPLARWSVREGCSFPRAL